MGAKKLSITMVAANEKKTTKSFDKMADNTNDAKLIDLAKSYTLLTNAVSRMAKKIDTTELDIVS